MLTCSFQGAKLYIGRTLFQSRYQEGEAVVVAQQLEVAVGPVNSLREAPLFGALPDGAIEGLAPVAELYPARRGELIVRPGEGGDGVYIVISGQISLGGDTITGRRVPLLE